MPVLEAGRYRQAPDAANASPGDPLDLQDSADNSFDVIGPAVPSTVAGRDLVFSNLGNPDADAYSGNNRRAGLAVNSGGQNLSFTAAPGLAANPANPRFFVVGTPITLACVPSMGSGQELLRHSNYGWLSAQPTASAALAAATRTRQLPGLRTCSAAYSTALANVGLLVLRLQGGVASTNAQL